MRAERRAPLTTTVAALVVCLVLWFTGMLFLLALVPFGPIALLIFLPVIVAALLIARRHGRA